MDYNEVDPKDVYIIRGLPGAGKSSLSLKLAGSPDNVCEADKFMVDREGNYAFDQSKLHYAHKKCKEQFKQLIHDEVPSIVVSNTSTTTREFKDYKVWAELNGYRVTFIILENRHGNESVHNVPEEAMTRMRDRFQIQL